MQRACGHTGERSQKQTFYKKQTAKKKIIMNLKLEFLVTLSLDPFPSKTQIPKSIAILKSKLNYPTNQNFSFNLVESTTPNVSCLNIKIQNLPPSCTGE